MERDVKGAVQVVLRGVRMSDIAVFFEHQLDPDANHMAAFTTKDPTDRDAFMARWERILADDGITKRTIVVDGEVVGHVASFERDDRPEVTYWIGREHWGRGIATSALSGFLGEVDTRPLYARVAADNTASLRVLQKCGFEITGEERGFANARDREIEEVILELGENAR